MQVGDVVCFKSDIEQCGTIVKIKTDLMGRKVLVLENENGFSGDYLRYATRTEELASDCWVE